GNTPGVRRRPSSIRSPPGGGRSVKSTRTKFPLAGPIRPTSIPPPRGSSDPPGRPTRPRPRGRGRSRFPPVVPGRLLPDCLVESFPNDAVEEWRCRPPPLPHTLGERGRGPHAAMVLIKQCQTGAPDPYAFHLYSRITPHS